MANVEAYCVKCKKKVTIKNPKVLIMKNGRPATTGICPECGTKLYKTGM